MVYHGLRSWPPVWTWVGGADNSRPKGEIGVLRGVKLSKIEPADRMFLYIEHENASYLGCLLLDHNAFCRQMAELLENCCGRSVPEIGELDLSYTL
jgi:hypothetical protein